MKSTDEGPFPRGDRVPAAQDGARFELEAIGRALDDLSPAQQRRPPASVRARLEWSAAAIIALIVFLGWLLVGR
ncbi:MAG TPA: hypothetical protein VN694_10740 [Caulobacteraceae bacterium]|nr:hypothetical protein [Caulobacteraceae bacterium]